MENIYAQMAARTGGNIYIGVVGPVRTGKSTLIKRIMEKLVIPAICDPYRAERARDELPQSGSGKTIMTSEPKFVPEEAVEICPDGAVTLRVRMIDSVGYMVDGAVGAEEDGVPRMVTTPWFSHEIPMTEAAELGTKKVMEDHCCLGLVVTTDGTVTDIDREDYLQAEERSIRDMAATGKPFLVIVNSKDPQGTAAFQTAEHIQKNYGLTPAVLDCQALEEADISGLLTKLLYAFPLDRVLVHLPRWLDALEPDHPVKETLYHALLTHTGQIRSLSQVREGLAPVAELEQVTELQIRTIDPGSGTAVCSIALPRSIFYELVSQRTGIGISDDGSLLTVLTDLSKAKKEYDAISDALSAVRATGYGIVTPEASDIALAQPQLLRRGGSCGISLKATAPSIHMIRVDIDAQISPTVGDEQQSKELLDYLSSQEPEALWQSNIFGKSVYELIREGLNTKLNGTSDEVRAKFRGSLSRIVNEGANGLICLIL